MNKKKIFFLVNSMEWGWAEKVIKNIIESSSHKFDITLITLKKESFYKTPNNITHIYLSNIKNNIIMAVMMPYFIYKFKRIYKNFDSWVSFLEISNFINILSNKNAFISFRTNINFFQWFIGYVYKLLIKNLYPKAKRIIVNCQENKFSLQK